METNRFPVAIIGAGPIGLAAAAHLLKRGEFPLVFEAGSTVGASVLQWGHVRLFSPWRELLDREAVALLEAEGWQAPVPQRTRLAASLWPTTSHHWQTRYS
jgi:cation diffusion facilitator CzcD-associated flavoprotein CzcO